MKKIFGFILVTMLAGTALAADVEVKRYNYGPALIPILTITEQELAFGATDTTKTFDVEGNGAVRAYTVTMPDFTNAVTGNLSIADAGSREIYNSDGRAEADFSENGATHVYNLRDVVGLYGTCTVTITLSGVPGGSGGTVKVHMELE